MTIHHLFIRPATRPALAPILFPIESMDELLWERATSHALANHAVEKTKLPFSICAHQLRWAYRLNERIARGGL